MRSTKLLLAALAALSLLAACETATKDGANGGAGGAGGAGGGSYGLNADGSVVPGSQADLEANAGDRVYFDTDSSVLTGEGQATLERQAEWLKKNSSVNVTIEGHCDERGTREYNLALGERRANAAKSYLVGQGIPASRVSTISYGKERPAALGHDADSWAQNRRAATVVIN